VNIGTLIDKRPDLKNGDACIAGTGLRVKTIAGWHKLGYTAEDIADDYEHITIAHVYAAIAYYYVNREEIEALLTRDEEALEELERAYAAGDPTVRPMAG